jgi:hypothetical protein
MDAVLSGAGLGAELPVRGVTGLVYAVATSRRTGRLRRQGHCRRPERVVPQARHAGQDRRWGGGVV